MDNNISTIEAAAVSHGVTSAILVNDDIPRVCSLSTGPQPQPTIVNDPWPWLRWNRDFSSGKVLLPAGRLTDEGVFTLPPDPPGIEYAADRTTILSYQQWINALVDSNCTLLPEDKRDKVLGILPLRNNGLRQLIGRTCIAVCYDSDISVKYDPLYGNLQGERYGLFAFRVVGVQLPGSTPESKSGTSLVGFWIEVLPPLDLSLYQIIPFVPDPSLQQYPDTVSLTRAEVNGGQIVVWAISSEQPVADLNVSIGDPAVHEAAPYRLPMTYNAAQGRCEFTTVGSATDIGLTVTVSSSLGGAYNRLVA